MDKSFKEQDKQDIIDYMNMVAKHAKFHMDTAELIKYFKLLSRMQQNILPKINAHILEVVAVHENDKEGN